MDEKSPSVQNDSQLHAIFSLNFCDKIDDSNKTTRIFKRVHKYFDCLPFTTIIKELHNSFEFHSERWREDIFKQRDQSSTTQLFNKGSVSRRSTQKNKILSSFLNDQIHLNEVQIALHSKNTYYEDPQITEKIQERKQREQTKYYL